MAVSFMGNEICGTAAVYVRANTSSRRPPRLRACADAGIRDQEFGIWNLEFVSVQTALTKTGRIALYGGLFVALAFRGVEGNAVRGH
jgi:hypothetical protein